jgi:tetratricopeptide (TPR) repeat protein
VRSPNAPLSGLLGEQALQNFNKINAFVLVYQSQGKDTEADPLYKQCLEIWEKVFGSDHPNVAQSLNNLADLYRIQGKYTEAEPLYNQALDIFKRALGPDHPYVAIVCENIEKCLKELGKEDEAVVYEEC